jgi:hypothetical protein
VPVPRQERFDKGVTKEIRPGFSRDIHIDRKQPVGVSLKGSSLRVLATCGLDENPEWSAGKSACATRQQVSRSSRPDGLGYLKSAAQAECYRVFDKMVERASREMNEGYGPSDLTRIRAIR